MQDRPDTRPERPRDPRDDFRQERPGNRNTIDDRLNPDGPPAPHDPNRIENALHPDGPPAPRAAHDPNRIENALHPDGPPAPHDPNRIENALNPDAPRDPRHDFQQGPESHRDSGSGQPPGDGFGSAPETRDEFVAPASEPDKAQYRRIREADDIQALADNTGFPADVVAEAKANLFLRQHDVATGPNQSTHGHFSPLDGLGPLWEKVARGEPLSPGETNQIRGLIAHEYVEAKLMEAGLPYLQKHPGAFDENGMARFDKEHIGAHTVAPLSLRTADIDILRHWDRIGLTKPAGGIAPDLSNLDDVVRAAREGLGL